MRVTCWEKRPRARFGTDRTQMSVTEVIQWSCLWNYQWNTKLNRVFIHCISSKQDSESSKEPNCLRSGHLTFPGPIWDDKAKDLAKWIFKDLSSFRNGRKDTWIYLNERGSSSKRNSGLVVQTSSTTMFLHQEGFCLQGTSGNAWRHTWWSRHAGGMLLVSRG